MEVRPEAGPAVIPVACCDTVNRGVTYADGKIFLNQLDTHTVALDAETGKELWKVKQGDYKKGQTMTSAPMVIKDKVISGISGGEFGVRGFVTANDVNTGKQVWRMYSTGPEAEVGFPGSVETWKGDEWKRGGGTTWGWYSYDPELDLFYYGTGNPGSWNPDQRPGDNKYSMTIFARNPDTGKGGVGVSEDAARCVGLRRHQRERAGRSRHRRPDAQGARQLRSQRVLVRAGSQDRRAAAGRAVRGRQLGEGRRPQDRPADRGSREADVGDEEHQGHLPVGDGRQEPAAGVLLAADRATSTCRPTTSAWTTRASRSSTRRASPTSGAIVVSKPGPGGNRGEFIAWDPTTGKKVWGIKEGLSAWGGALATGGDVVFYGTMEGWLKAVHAKTGEVLWKFKTPSGIIGNPMTYVGPDGKQYVAVLSGVGGWSGIGVAADMSLEDPTAGLGAIGAFRDLANFSNQGGVLTVFALP